MTIHPAPHYIRTTRSEVKTTEDQTASGLHIVRNVDPDDTQVIRGIVEEIGESAGQEFSDLAAGCVLFYTRAIRLGGHDFVLAHYEIVIGWESPL